MSRAWPINPNGKGTKPFCSQSSRVMDFAEGAFDRDLEARANFVNHVSDCDACLEQAMMLCPKKYFGPELAIAAKVMKQPYEYFLARHTKNVLEMIKESRRRKIPLKRLFAEHAGLVDKSMARTISAAFTRPN